MFDIQLEYGTVGMVVRKNETPSKNKYIAPQRNCLIFPGGEHNITLRTV